MMCQGKVWRCLRRRDLDMLDRGRDGLAPPRVERTGLLYAGWCGPPLRISGQRERGGGGGGRSWGGGGGGKIRVSVRVRVRVRVRI